MIWLVYSLRNKTKFNFDFRFFLISTWHCRVAMQFEYCFSVIGLYIDIYGYGMLSMGFWLLSRRNIISLCSTFLSWDTQLQLSICLLFFLYCYFTLYLVVLPLKIDHCLVFISIELSYLILSYLTSVWNWVVYSPFAIQNDPYT
jgi:hypothetical protein